MLSPHQRDLTTRSSEQRLAVRLFRVHNLSSPASVAELEFVRRQQLRSRSNEYLSDQSVQTRMKSTFLCLVAVAAFAVSSHAQDAANSFPKVGASYDASFAHDAHADDTFRLSGSDHRIKVLAAGGGSWFRVEYDEPDSPMLRQSLNAPRTPVTTHKQQKWINFAFVVSAQEVTESK